MSGNKDLFDSIYNDYHAMVFQMCRGFMRGDTDLATDLTQEVFINTWSALSKFNHAASLKTWIYRITVNTCLKYIRDKKDMQAIPMDGNQVLLKIESVPETNHESLYWAIGQLKEVDRLIIMMVLDDLEYEEISKVIGISEGNLRVKISRIKKNLKKIMENE